MKQWAESTVGEQSMLCPEEANFLLDAAQDAILVISTEREIIYANKGLANLAGLDQVKLLGVDLVESLFSNPESIADILAAITACQNEGHWAGILELIHADGETKHLHSRWSQLPSFRGHRSAILMIASDVTEQRQLEDKVRRAQRLESLGTMATGIAHDLNNILTPIIISSGMLRSYMEAPDCDHYVDTIERNAKRGADVVQQILTFARGGKGEKIPFQVVFILKEIVRMARETFPKSVHCESEYKDGLWPVVGNASQLYQVFMNLIINGRDAVLPQGGDIRIACSNRRLNAQETSLFPDGHAGTYVMVEIEDTGIGIPSNELEHIFDPFFTTKPAGKGTGLGLATVRGIVKEHGGFIQVKSTLGQGTRFQVFLPADPDIDLNKENPQTKSDAHHGNGETIMVVDDEPSIRQMVGEALEKHGYTPVYAENGSEAISKYLQQDVALVITDIDMPHLNGVALLQALNQMKSGIKSICISGSISKAAEAQLEQLGVRGILHKPFHPQLLLERVYHALRTEGC